ncbi:MAG TPA: glycosyl hydrolase [Acidimicrobiia bacterium]|nr:glycosyl hydrolase [Acidimicrobiia bacterium]
MSPAAPGRLRGFFSSRTGIAVAVIGVLCLAGATAFALRGDEEGVQEFLPPPTTTTTVTTAPPPPAGGVLVGASISSEIRSLGAEKSAVEELERAIGRTLDIHHNFYTWDEAFPTDVERSDLQDGRIPMISWNGRGVTTRAIAAGRYDDMIEQRARDTKALGQPVLVRWFWEMDGNKKAEWAGTPDQYIAAWRHIVQIFRNQGADNVRWVWCPNASAFNDGEAQQFYPGPDFVDWVCGDGYNWAPGRAGDDYRSFTEIFSGFYLWAAQQNKPIMVGEFGVQERKPGEKADWITATREAIKTDFPLMKAIVYFSANKDYDWRLTTSDSALESFRQLANDPWFNLGVNRRLPG